VCVSIFNVSSFELVCFFFYICHRICICCFTFMPNLLKFHVQSDQRTVVLAQLTSLQQRFSQCFTFGRFLYIMLFEFPYLFQIFYNYFTEIALSKSSFLELSFTRNMYIHCQLFFFLKMKCFIFVRLVKPNSIFFSTVGTLVIYFVCSGALRSLSMCMLGHVGVV